VPEASTPLPQAVIFDVDGTLADVSGIRHYVQSDPKNRNFEKFHAAASLVPPHPEVVELAASMRAAGFAILVVTSRKERWRWNTTLWLRKWEVEHDGLHMRADDDGRRDVDVKRDILWRLQQRYRIVLAVDDNPSVIALWNAEHIPVVTWPGWSDDPA
jgi:FMN phosphatase YigB (HAD superfamily)